MKKLGNSPKRKLGFLLDCTTAFLLWNLVYFFWAFRRFTDMSLSRTGHQFERRFFLRCLLIFLFFSFFENYFYGAFYGDFLLRSLLSFLEIFTELFTEIVYGDLFWDLYWAFYGDLFTDIYFFWYVSSFPFLKMFPRTCPFPGLATSLETITTPGNSKQTNTNEQKNTSTYYYKQCTPRSLNRLFKDYLIGFSGFFRNFSCIAFFVFSCWIPLCFH